MEPNVFAQALLALRDQVDVLQEHVVAVGDIAIRTFKLLGELNAFTRALADFAVESITSLNNSVQALSGAVMQNSNAIEMLQINVSRITHNVAILNNYSVGALALGAFNFVMLVYLVMEVIRLRKSCKCKGK